jgi:hypothetical protein
MRRHARRRLSSEAIVGVVAGALMGGATATAAHLIGVGWGGVIALLLITGLLTSGVVYVLSLTRHAEHSVPDTRPPVRLVAPHRDRRS